MPKIAAGGDGSFLTVQVNSPQNGSSNNNNNRSPQSSTTRSPQSRSSRTPQSTSNSNRSPQNGNNNPMNWNDDSVIHAEAVVVPDTATIRNIDYSSTNNINSIQEESNAPIVWPNINDAAARRFLSEYSWPQGLQDTLIRNLNKIPIRFMICDDSGSMVANDGHKLIKIVADKSPKMISCTRWSELTDAFKFHVGLSHAACAVTEVRLLNRSSPIRVGDNFDSQDRSRYEALLANFDASPGGATPLCWHINEVVDQITSIASQLRAHGQKACVMIATDGESSDGDIAAAMRPLERLPVWVVVRLCTDDERIVNYWNNIDGQLELEMDVLDDLCGEASEVHGNNPWLTYGEPLHRLREFGIPTKEIDLLDESKLSSEQLRIVCSYILGGNVNEYPHPEADWDGFVRVVSAKNSATGDVWSPMKKMLRPWIDVATMSRSFGHNSSSCSIA